MGLEAVVGADGIADSNRLGQIAPPGGLDFCDVRDVAAGILAALERGAAAGDTFSAANIFPSWNRGG